MTRRQGDGLPPAEDYERMFEMAEAYRAKFGVAVGVYQVMGRPAAVARELAALERGQPLSMDELYRRIGMTPPPDDAVL